MGAIFADLFGNIFDPKSRNFRGHEIRHFADTVFDHFGLKKSALKIAQKRDHRKIASRGPWRPVKLFSYDPRNVGIQHTNGIIG
jgi:hypothetical protein